MKDAVSNYLHFSSPTQTTSPTKHSKMTAIFFTTFFIIYLHCFKYRISRPIRSTFFPWKMWPKFDLRLMHRG